MNHHHNSRVQQDGDRQHSPKPPEPVGRRRLGIVRRPAAIRRRGNAPAPVVSLALTPLTWRRRSSRPPSYRSLNASASSRLRSVLAVGRWRAAADALIWTGDLRARWLRASQQSRLVDEPALPNLLTWEPSASAGIAYNHHHGNGARITRTAMIQPNAIHQAALKPRRSARWRGLGLGWYQWRSTGRDAAAFWACGTMHLPL